ncbi:MAG: DUF2281 domain-containing protein [Bacteroidetes bacterium]|nr:DUF2281 domain-containing protein [Bacteroidota bacterium]
MLTSVRGIYENGEIVLLEKPDINKRTSVIVTFTEEVTPQLQPRKPGGLKGKIHLPENFNDPLDDLKDYMF